jgi:hypothetical protein
VAHLRDIAGASSCRTAEADVHEIVRRKHRGRDGVKASRSPAWRVAARVRQLAKPLPRQAQRGFAPSTANAHLALPCEPVDQAGGRGSTGELATGGRPRRPPGGRAAALVHRF